MLLTSRIALASLVLAALAASTGSSSAAQTDANAHGRAIFQTYCSVCHGAKGEGFIGPRIGGIPWTASSLGTIVHNGLSGYGGMPAFSKDSVSDGDVAAIAGYLGSVAATATASPPASTSNSSPDAARGAKLYASNCAACHGAQGQGGFGPSLHNEKSRKNFNAAVSWIENPAPPMPKLYPSAISKQDVEDIAAFIEKL
jgi:cytochrome c oxidase cbb3-type subunit 3